MPREHPHQTQLSPGKRPVVQLGHAHPQDASNVWTAAAIVERQHAQGTSSKVRVSVVAGHLLQRLNLNIAQCPTQNVSLALLPFSISILNSGSYSTATALESDREFLVGCAWLLTHGYVTSAKSDVASALSELEKEKKAVQKMLEDVANERASL